MAQVLEGEVPPVAAAAIQEEEVQPSGRQDVTHVAVTQKGGCNCGKKAKIARPKVSPAKAKALAEARKAIKDRLK